MRTRTCGYQGVINFRFSENLVCFVFLKQPFWDSPFCLITDSYAITVSCKTLRDIGSQKKQWESAVFLPEAVFRRCYLRTCLPEARNFIAKETPTQVFSYELYEIFKYSFSDRTPVTASAVLKSRRNSSWKNQTFYIEIFRRHFSRVSSDY